MTRARREFPQQKDGGSLCEADSGRAEEDGAAYRHGQSDQIGLEKAEGLSLGNKSEKLGHSIGCATQRRIGEPRRLNRRRPARCA